MIDAYSFGRMTINGKTYTSDLILYPDKIDSSWWRRSGHLLCIEDVQHALDENPQVLIIGTGYMGLMKVTEELKTLADERHFELIIQTSKKAVQTFNKVFKKKRTIAAFHLTC